MHSEQPTEEATNVSLYGTADDSIVDGPGIRFTVFVQGCARNCEGCHNPGALSYEGGSRVSVDALIERVAANPLLAGITLSGGEPFDQAASLVELARWARGRVLTGPSRRPLTVWAYSGYRFEELLRGEPTSAAAELLRCCDVLVDGPFVIAQHSHDLRWRGSANQRVIDVQASLATGEAVAWCG
ncbi:MAG: anaerobic ribonucleoside-triphosphate reductase activating protein [Coriobacteriales bacterium]|jgi:anaerobic ribonucleoside-triphosphate reductase activating protein|nr:anaerobic ribonucleoside-triphosphate reductase activating protein [Coriobacteriales bacterium]